MLRVEIIDGLLNLLNNSWIKGEEEYSFGLLYKYSYENGMHVLLIGKRDFNNDDEEFCENEITHDIKFNTKYELVEYLLWMKYNIEFLDIFNLEDTKLESIELNFYEKKEFNDFLKELLMLMKKDNEFKDSAIFFNNEIKNIKEDTEKILDIFNVEDKKNYITFDKAVYTQSSYGSNCGVIWGNITNFKILDFDINSRNSSFIYSLDVKFQIESFIEEKNMYNYYDVKILDFLVFPTKMNENSFERKSLKNNLSLVYNLTDDVMYDMILNEYPNFKKYPVTISSISGEIELEDFKEEVLSKLAKRLKGLFYVGNNDIYTEEDMKEFYNEFMKRSFFEFKEQMFADFMISSTGIRIYDLNTVDSFYTMVNKIARNLVEESNNEGD